MKNFPPRLIRNRKERNFENASSVNLEFSFFSAHNSGFKNGDSLLFSPSFFGHFSTDCSEIFIRIFHSRSVLQSNWPDTHYKFSSVATVIIGGSIKNAEKLPELHEI